MRTDPSGRTSLTEVVAITTIVGILSAIVPQPLGNASVSKFAWDGQDILDFRTFTAENYRKYIGVPTDCADLALTMLVDFAYSRGLPVRLLGFGSTRLDSTAGVYRNKWLFLNAVKSRINADAVYDFNSFEKGAFDLSHAGAAQVGDLIMRHSYIPDTILDPVAFLDLRLYGHTQVFLEPRATAAGPGALIIQGNLNSGAPVPVVVKPVLIPSTAADFTIRWWNPSVFGR